MTTLVRVHLKRSLQKPNVDAELVRRAVVELARFACDDGNGRQKGDPVFERVTEKRQACWNVNGARRCYSGCGDLAQFVSWLVAGATQYAEPELRAALNYVNRAEAWGWRQGWNIARLDGYSPAKKRNMPGAKSIDLRPGFLLLIGEDGAEHIMVVEDFDGSKLTSLDYGQFFARPNEPAEHGGKRCVRYITRGPDFRLWAHGETLPGRPIVWSIDTGEALRAVGAVGSLTSAVVPSTFAGGVPDDNPYHDAYSIP